MGGGGCSGSASRSALKVHSTHASGLLVRICIERVKGKEGEG